ncbi:hypothetical protein CDL12_16918 [Handroanthus impetiginosus]|uniref:DUF241 domain-containing protein n=1 Tax=Handroanthus impetiginosus TaxID=429701 RepID=A0A2G9GYY3_9LAMI|nr:hypothetical protein CDL12_16918 [Handroanthus impetiginosus]
MFPQLHHIKGGSLKLCSKLQIYTFHNTDKKPKMASTPLRSKILSQTRSTSLPSRSHPLVPQFNEHMHKLKSCDSTPSSISSINKKLQNLEDLYNCVDDLLLLPHTQQVFAQECNGKWVEEILDGYLCLVDACATAKDFILHSKEYVLDLLSTLRRRRDSDYFCGFLTSRKMAKKMIQKSLRNLSSFKNKPSILALEKDQETIAIISMLKETESMTLDLIEALLLSICGMKGHSRQSGWSLVSRLMSSRKISGQDSKDAVQFGELDATLCKIVSLRTLKCEQIDELQQQLKDMDLGIQVVEESLECLFKRLIKTRVSLLNMHSQ